MFDQDSDSPPRNERRQLADASGSYQATFGGLLVFYDM